MARLVVIDDHLGNAFCETCKLGCEGIVSIRLGSILSFDQSLRLVGADHAIECPLLALSGHSGAFN
jgi:hypothetical protein